MGPSSQREPTAADTGRQQGIPPNWRAALMDLIAARVALIQLESKDVAASAARRAIQVVVASGCILVTWALALAGGISWISEASGWPWSRIALITAGGHLLVGLVLIRLIMRPAANAAFPVTRAEFQKDREWIEKFHETKNSNG
jgi:Putative Actinobacterial Holin-X, holin superfamily III